MVALTAETACCGTNWCTCTLCFDAWFCRVRDFIYPPIDGLVCGGVFDRLVQSMLKPLWDVYREHCLLCDLPFESNPALACCLMPCWAEEFGLPDDCYEGKVCFTDVQQVNVALAAQVTARAILEFGGIQDLAFYTRIACPLGIEFELTMPPVTSNTFDPCDHLTPTSPASDSVPCGNDRIVGPVECFKAHLHFHITAAPRTLHATICSPLGQPFCWNPWIDAFECLVRRMTACHVDVSFSRANPLEETEPPVLGRVCANDLGLYIAAGIGGTGTVADPLVFDPASLRSDQLLALSQALAGTTEGGS